MSKENLKPINMTKIETRKVIALGSFVVVAFIAIYSLITGAELNQTGTITLSALIGSINWYFAKSTALEQPKKDGEYHDNQ